jgi:ubiquinone biosynthesis protein UbiJ
LRTARAQWLTSRESLKRQTEEFLRSEQTTHVTAEAFSDAETRVTSLTRQIDRLDARMKRLEAQHG